MKLRKEYEVMIGELLDPLNSKWTFESGGKHPILRFELRGKEHTHSFPCTSGDSRRSVLHMRGQLRRHVKAILEGRSYVVC